MIPVLCVEAIKAGLCHVRRELGLSCTTLLIHAYLSTITRYLWLYKINHCVTNTKACVVFDPLHLDGSSGILRCEYYTRDGLILCRLDQGESTERVLQREFYRESSTVMTDRDGSMAELVKMLLEDRKRWETKSVKKEVELAAERARREREVAEERERRDVEHQKQMQQWSEQMQMMRALVNGSMGAMAR